MKSVSINRKVSLTLAERETIVRSLVSKGIDESLVRSALATVGEGTEGCTKADHCVHCKGKCNSYFKVDIDAMNKLKREMDAKGIKMTNVDPAVAKLFR